jgi:hypothetical protein
MIVLLPPLLPQVGTLLHKLEAHLKGHMKQSHAAYDETIGELAAAAEPAAAPASEAAASEAAAASAAAAASGAVSGIHAIGCTSAFGSLNVLSTVCCSHPY